MADGRHLEIESRPEISTAYIISDFSHRSTNFNHIWHDDAVRPSGAFLSLEFQKKIKLQDGSGRHPGKSKNRHISDAFRQISTKFARRRSSTLLSRPTVKISNFTIQDGGGRHLKKN